MFFGRESNMINMISSRTTGSAEAELQGLRKVRYVINMITSRVTRSAEGKVHDNQQNYKVCGRASIPFSPRSSEGMQPSPVARVEIAVTTDTPPSPSLYSS
ncbi:hypothetical protein J6590_005741 [Homalodisca vitripennis]|nr:hypothetical protein J6590_005741 [Homalodisca vitripennis]